MLGRFPDSSEVDWGSVFALSFIALTLTVLGFVVSAELGNTGLRVIDFAISGLLSAALVVLYSRQAEIMKSQSNLLEQEMNREARQQHSETLRKRVEIWHGNPEKEVGDNPIDTPSMNTPTVGRSSFNSASPGYAPASSGDEPFHVIPQRLKGDRYLEDLLENHAHDLRETAEEIRALKKEYDQTLVKFEDEFDIEVNREYEQYTIQDTDDLATWVFGLLVEQERGIIDDARIDGISRCIVGRTSKPPGESKIEFQIEEESGQTFSILAAHVEDLFELDTQSVRSSVEKDGREIMEDVFDQINNETPYETVVTGASILEEGRETVDELERTLIEYHGRPIIPGDCKYLEEARAE